MVPLPMDYVEPPDCPEGMTLRDWRAGHRAEPARPRRFSRLLGRLRFRRRPA